MCGCQLCKLKIFFFYQCCTCHWRTPYHISLTIASVHSHCTLYLKKVQYFCHAPKTALKMCSVPLEWYWALCSERVCAVTRQEKTKNEGRRIWHQFISCHWLQVCGCGMCVGVRLLPQSNIHTHTLVFLNITYRTWYTPKPLTLTLAITNIPGPIPCPHFVRLLDPESNSISELNLYLKHHFTLWVSAPIRTKCTHNSGIFHA